MPKVLLKRFHNDNNRFFYYDIQKQIIGNNGTAKSINTQLGYYSQQTEDYFRDNIETPFGEVLTYIEKTGIALCNRFVGENLGKNFYSRAIVHRDDANIVLGCDDFAHTFTGRNPHQL